MKRVTWTGRARDYWNNMAAIHHEIVAELFNESKLETPEKALESKLETPEIDIETPESNLDSS